MASPPVNIIRYSNGSEATTATARRPMKKAIRDMEPKVDVFKFREGGWSTLFESHDCPDLYWCFSRKEKPASKFERINSDEEHEIIGRMRPDGIMEEIS